MEEFKKGKDGIVRNIGGNFLQYQQQRENVQKLIEAKKEVKLNKSEIHNMKQQLNKMEKILSQLLREKDVNNNTGTSE